MNKSKVLSMGLLALGCASLASAQTFVKITGSTAFRKAAYFSIVNSLNNPKGAAIGGSAADFTGASRAVITGTLKSGPSAGQAVVFQTAFGGSSGGLDVVTNNLNVIPGTGFASTATWMSSTGNTLTNLAVGASAISGANILAAGSASFDGASTADVAHSDTFQSTTPFKTPALSEENAAGNGVGVIEFDWVKSNRHPDVPVASYNAFNNITNLQAQLLLANGALPLSLFTGNPADLGIDVLLVGRNDDSGTRTTTQAESAYGFNQLESQYKPTPDTGTISGAAFVGNVGFASGGNVAASLNRPIAAGSVDGNGVPFIFVGYLGKGDKNTAVSGATPGVALNWNGSPVSDTAIQNGAYTFWSYAHIYYRPTLAGVKKDATDLYSNQIRLADAPQSGLILSSMGVSRTIEGGVVSP